MAPGYRANNQSRRANRSYIDHDVFEGLPVRNWRRDTVTTAPPPVHEIAVQKDKWDVELPWGMPKDCHLLPQHSQDLLRVARSGRLYMKRSAAEEEEVDVEAAAGDKPEKKEEDQKEKGFSVKTWKLVPKHQEGPEIEFLAKRRKGLTGTAVKTVLTSGPTMAKARVRKTDAAGNMYFEDIVVAEGQTLDDHLISQTAFIDSVASKAVVDAIPALPTPPRRRPPPPKRKAKGPGRGRKRKLPLAPTSVPGQPGAVEVGAENGTIGVSNDPVAPEGIKREKSNTVNNENENEDVEMGDDALNPSDEEGEDASDEDDLSEGEGQSEHDEDDAESREANRPELARTETNESADATDDHGVGPAERDVSSSPDLPLAVMGSMLGHEHGTAGSPLRNVVTFAPTFQERSPELAIDSEAEAEGDEDEIVNDDIHASLRGETEDNGIQGAYQMPQEEHLSTGQIGDGMPMEQNQDYIDADELLLDGDISGMDFSNMPAEPQSYPEPYADDEEEIMPVPVQEQEQVIHHPDSRIPDPESHFSAQDTVADQPVMGLSEEAGEEAEDNFEDLLGSLEDHLNQQGAEPKVKQADDEANVEDEVDHLPMPAQSAVTPTTPQMVETAAVRLPRQELAAGEAAMERVSIDVVADANAVVEVREKPAEEMDTSAPPPVGPV